MVIAFNNTTSAPAFLKVPVNIRKASAVARIFGVHSILGQFPPSEALQPHTLRPTGRAVHRYGSWNRYERQERLGRLLPAELLERRCG